MENKYWNNSIVVIIIYITFIKQKNEKTWKCFLMGIHNVYMLEFAENYIVGSFSFFTLSIGKFVHSKNQQLAHSEFFNMEFEPSRYFFLFIHFNFASLPCNYVNENKSHYIKWTYSMRKKSLSISLTNLVIIKLGTLHKYKWYFSKLNHSYLQINNRIQERDVYNVLHMVY